MKFKVLDELPTIRKPQHGKWPRAIERALRDFPGKWIQVKRYSKVNVANATAYHLRNRYGDNGYGRVEFKARDGAVLMRAHRRPGRPKGN